MDEDIVETIPKSMEKFLGCSGKMVKPSVSSVRNVVKDVKEGRLITLEQLRDKLAKDFKVQTACPAKVAKALEQLSKESNPVCYWCVVKKNGALISKYPNGVDGHAAMLQKENINIDHSKKIPLVIDFYSKLFGLT